MSDNNPMSNSNDWAQFYQQNLTRQGMVPASGHDQGSSVADSTVMTTSSITSGGIGSGSAGGGRQLSPDGRVVKPTRRRRASRAAPTTLLNTDTTNFRAMVQQFTGVPNANFSFGSHASSPNINFGISGHSNPSTTTMMPHGYYNPQQRQHQQQQQQQQQYHHQQYMYSTNALTNEGMVSGFNSNPRPDLDGSDGLFMDNYSSQLFPRSSSSNDNRSSGYNM